MNHAMLRRMSRDPVFVTAAVVATTLLLLAFLMPLLSSASPSATRLDARLQAPSWLGGQGVLGTDQLGRDVLLRISYGLRTSFLVALIAIAVSALIGTVIGILAGYLGGRFDSVLMRITDVWISFPGLLMTMAVITFVGQGVATVAIVLGLATWMMYARVLRSAVLSLKGTELITASTAMGSTSFRTMVRHVLPNILAPLASVTALEFATVMLAEASLSFLGLGVQPPTVSLGAILSDGRGYIRHEWWIVTFAGLFLSLTVLSTNLIASWFQRNLDPTARATALN